MLKTRKASDAVPSKPRGLGTRGADGLSFSPKSESLRTRGPMSEDRSGYPSSGGESGFTPPPPFALFRSSVGWIVPLGEDGVLDSVY